MSRTEKLELTVGGLHFVATLPAATTTVAKGRKGAVELRYLIAFDRLVMKVLTEQATPTGESFAFLRTRCQLKAQEVANLFGYTPETLSRWENGKNVIPGPAWALMAKIAEDKLAGRSDTLDWLRRRRAKRSTARTGVRRFNRDDLAAAAIRARNTG